MLSRLSGDNDNRIRNQHEPILTKTYRTLQRAVPAWQRIQLTHESNTNAVLENTQSSKTEYWSYFLGEVELSGECALAPKALI
jgi:hypothetical protein